MSVVSIRLDEAVQATLEEAARDQGIGLSSYLRRVAEEEARRVRRERIREQSRAVADYVASSAEARQFFDDWGGPTAEDKPA